MHLHKNVRILFSIFLSIIFITGCSIKTGPNLTTPVSTSPKEPLFRVGEITENMTGSWVNSAYGKPSGFRAALIDALKKPEIASRFSPSSSSLTLNMDLVSDHEDDGPRLSNLGMLSIATLGIIPLNYFSQWNVDCSIKVIASDGNQVADYVFQETGTYKIWAFPLTMLTLSGAGIRGDHDGRVIYDKVAKSLAAKIAAAIDQDYERLAARAGKKIVIKEEKPVELPKPVIL